MSTSWIPYAIYIVGIVSAALVLLAGIVVAFLMLMGVSMDKLWDRVWPSFIALLLSSTVAAIILALTRWALS